MSPSGSSVPRLSFSSLSQNNNNNNTCLLVCITNALKNPPAAHTMVWRLVKYPHVLGGNLVKAVDQLGDEVVVPAGQETVDLFGDPPIVQQTLSGGGRERGRQGKLV